MAKKITYKTFLINGPNKGVYAEFPFDSEKKFGTRRAVRVRVKIEGTQYLMSLLPNGKSN